MESQKVIAEYERRLIEAQHKSDVRELNDLLHDELLFVIPNGEIISKQIDLDSHSQGSMVVDSSNPLDQTIKIIGDTAVVVTTIELKGQYKGHPIDGKFIYNRVWKQFGNEWKMIAGCAIQING